MNIPFVKVNNQQEFDRVVDKMKKETGLECGNKYYDQFYPIVGVLSDNSYIVCWAERSEANSHISADEYLTGIKENFSLNDLEDGMVVEISENETLLVLKNKLFNIKSHESISNYKKDFSHKIYKNLDILRVYNTKNIYDIEYTLKGSNLTLIFDAEAYRNKSKISQRKLEIENEIKKLEKELKSLEVK